MRLIIALFLLSLVANVHGEPLKKMRAECFDRVGQDNRAGDTITVLTDDSIVIRGHHPIFDATASILYLRQITDMGATSHLTIPYDRINKITYRKPSGVRWVLTVAGYCLGAFAGAMAGASFEDDGWDKMNTGFISGIAGGFIGAAIGLNIGKRFTSEVTVECR